jgi:hypothetical protein
MDQKNVVWKAKKRRLQAKERVSIVIEKEDGVFDACAS